MARLLRHLPRPSRGAVRTRHGRLAERTNSQDQARVRAASRDPALDQCRQVVAGEARLLLVREVGPRGHDSKLPPLSRRVGVRPRRADQLAHAARRMCRHMPARHRSRSTRPFPSAPRATRESSGRRAARRRSGAATRSIARTTGAEPGHRCNGLRERGDHGGPRAGVSRCVFMFCEPPCSTP